MAVSVCRCYIGGRGVRGVFVAISLHAYIYRYIGIAHFAFICEILLCGVVYP